MKLLPLLSILAVLIAAQDTKTVVFPPSGNDSTFELGGRIESTIRPDMTHLSGPLARPSTIATNYYLPAPQRTFVHHRSDSVPYAYENPHFGYPIAHAIDHSIGPSSKHLVIVSFIGLLLLFAIIQNTITAVKRREALIEVLSTRQKRDVYPTFDFNSVSSEQEDILNDDARVRCIQRTVCLENRKLFKELGYAGKILAKYLTRGVEKSLKPSTGWDRLVEDAGKAGIRGDDCNVLYRDCDASVSTGHREEAYDKSQRK